MAASAQPQVARPMMQKPGGLADAFAGPSGRANVPQASRSQRQSDVARNGSATSPSGRSSFQGQRGGRGAQRKSAEPGSREADLQWWRDTYGELEKEKRQVVGDLDFKREDQAALATEVQYLRQELEKEKAETEKATRQFEERIEHERRESTRMQMALMKAQIGGSNTDSDASVIRRDVTDKTNEILEAMREIREQQQQAFKQIKSLSYAMLKACSQPTPGATGSAAGVSGISSAGSDVGRGTVFVNGTRSPPRSPPSSVAGNLQHVSPGRGPSPPGSLVGGRQRSPSEAGQRQRSPALKTVPESDGGRRLRVAQRSPSASPTGEDGSQRWFRQMQANLEQFGDVEVFTEEGSQECMCCNQPIISSYRVRPRKCSHVFHIECLLQWWTEGTCPVCHASFAPEEAPPEARLTERSSISTSATRREAAWKAHWRRRSPASTASGARSRASSPSQSRPLASDAGLRGGQAAEASREPATPLRQSMSPQSNPL